jgi:hypothetical protein
MELILFGNSEWRQRSGGPSGTCIEIESATNVNRKPNLSLDRLVRHLTYAEAEAAFLLVLQFRNAAAKGDAMVRTIPAVSSIACASFSPVCIGSFPECRGNRNIPTKPSTRHSRTLDAHVTDAN